MCMFFFYIFFYLIIFFLKKNKYERGLADGCAPHSYAGARAAGVPFGVHLGRPDDGGESLLGPFWKGIVIFFFYVIIIIIIIVVVVSVLWFSRVIDFDFWHFLKSLFYFILFIYFVCIRSLFHR